MSGRLGAPGPILLAGLLCACSGPSPDQTERTHLEVVEEVAALLEAQSAAWSDGDLEGFTSVYAEDCTFLSPTGVTIGRQQVLERYRRRYPDPAAMGALSLEIIEMRPAVQRTTALFGAITTGSITGISVAARWTLRYPDREAATGLTLIVLHRQDGEWRIVQDASL